MEQFRRFDHDLKKIILNDKYAFAFNYFDGFSERLLFADLTIDWGYNYVLMLEFSGSKSVHLSPYQEEGVLSPEIHSFFDQLIESDFLSLKDNYDYGMYGISDIGSQHYLINLDKTTKNVYIIDGLPEDYFETPTERLLYRFNEYLKNLVEEKYAYLISS